MEHAEVHRRFGHFLPCSLGRELDLASIDWTNAAGASLPVSYFRDKLQQLMPLDWRDNYVEGAVRSPDHHENESGYWARASAHLNNRLVNEAYMTADAIMWLKRAQHVSPSSQSLRRDAKEFFGGSTPADSFYWFLQKRNVHEDWKWSKPLEWNVRWQLARICRNVKPEPMRHRQRDQLIDLLEKHRDDLYRCVSSWEPNPQKYKIALPPDIHVRSFPVHLLGKSA